jgi:hypothetical protein
MYALMYLVRYETKYLLSAKPKVIIIIINNADSLCPKMMHQGKNAQTI